MLRQSWVELALSQQQISDRIVDEHSLLLYIKYTAERPKRTRRGYDIPGTFPGAVGLVRSPLKLFLI